MNRPTSIVWFERLSLLSLALIVPQDYLAWDELMAAAEADGVNPLVVVAVAQGIAIALSLFLILMVSRARSRVFKWIYSGLSGLGLIWTFFTLPSEWTAQPLAGSITAAQNLMVLIAIVLLFRSDSVRWLAGEDRVDPSIFS